VLFNATISQIKMSKRKPVGSPIVKSVVISKKKLIPSAHINSNSEWSTVEQSTVGKTCLEMLSHDWSEEDSGTGGEDSMEDTGENSICNSSLEQLREAEVPVLLAQLAPGPLHRIQKAQPVRSPTVHSLGDLLDIKRGKFPLLPICSDSFSEESDVDSAYNLSENRNMREVMTSTMMLGGKGRKESVVAENISSIMARDSLDLNLSSQPPVISNLKTRLSQERETGAAVASSVSSRAAANVLSSTPARKGGPEHSLELSSIHGSDAGGSMLVPRVVREMLTEDMVEEETELIGATWYMLEEEDETTKQPLNIKEATTEAVNCKPGSSSPSHLEKSTLPPQSRGHATINESDIVRASRPDMYDVLPELGRGKDADVSRVLGDTIESELSQISPDNSARTIRSRTALSSEDTSGEIFSAVVHRNQTAIVVNYPSIAARSSAKEPIRKKFKLSSRNSAATQLSIFSKREYYRGKPASERMFDELMEEEEND